MRYLFLVLAVAVMAVSGVAIQPAFDESIVLGFAASAVALASIPLLQWAVAGAMY